MKYSEYDDICTLIEMVDEEEDRSMVKEIEKDIAHFEEDFEKLILVTLPSFCSFTLTISSITPFKVIIRTHLGKTLKNDTYYPRKNRCRQKSATDAHRRQTSDKA